MNLTRLIAIASVVAGMVVAGERIAASQNRRTNACRVGHQRLSRTTLKPRLSVALVAARVAGFLVLLIAIAAAGCVPYWHWHYYRPDATIGTVERPYCGGRVGPLEALVLWFGDAKVRVAAHQTDRSEAVVVHVLLHLTARHTARLLEGQLTVMDNRTSEEWRTRVSEVRRLSEYVGQAGVEVAVDETLHGEESTGHLRGSYFSVRIPVTDRPVDDFTIALPRLELDGAPTQLPRVRFQRSIHRMFFAPINC
jgi:hypothetical protein